MPRHANFHWIAPVAAALALSSCFHVPSDAEIQTEADLLVSQAAEAADAAEDRRAMAEMQERAAACGTTLLFSGEPRLEDRRVFVPATATKEQLECIRKSYPFVEALPR